MADLHLAQAKHKRIWLFHKITLRKTRVLKFPSKKHCLVSLSLLVTSTTTLATPLGSADMFNAYARNSFSYGPVDIEGVIGGGGNITYTGGDVGRNAGTDNTYSVYAGGDVTISNHYVNNGGIQAGGNVSTTNTTLGGSVSAKGDVTINAGSLASPTNRSITSEGDVTLKSFGMTSGTVQLSGNFDNEWGGNFTGSTLIKGPGATTTADSWYLAQGTVVNSAAPNVALIDHQQVSNDIVSASQGYAAMAANNSAASPWINQWRFDGNGGLNIFSIDAGSNSMFNYFDSLTFSGAGDTTLVINVGGFDIDFGLGKMGGYQFLGMDASKVLFNFYEATMLDISGSLWGTVLAPFADVTTYGNGTVFGSIYANNISGSSQINSIYFQGEGPATSIPEPSTIALLGLGLIPLVLRRKNNHRAALSA